MEFAATKISNGYVRCDSTLIPDKRKSSNNLRYIWPTLVSIMALSTWEYKTSLFRHRLQIGAILQWRKLWKLDSEDHHSVIKAFKKNNLELNDFFLILGPAGTGKTESVKALGNQLGRFVLVFNCDETFDFQAMGRIFVGLCQVGAWGCFDEFNRLEERMLSAVSQQVQTIQEALKSQKEASQDGSPIGSKKIRCEIGC